MTKHIVMAEYDERDPKTWGRQVDANVIDLTKYGLDGPGKRKRSIDDLYPRYIDADQFAALELYLTALALLPDMIAGGTLDSAPPASFTARDWKCQSDDPRARALRAIAGAQAAILRETGLGGLRLFAALLSGQRVAYLAQQRGFTHKGGAYGHAEAMKSEVRAVFAALESYFDAA